jgi:hypothetical protein
VVAEPAFAALRDGAPSAIPGVQARRPGMEEVFSVLADHGIARENLVLAFDFHTASDAQQTDVMLSMRDQAYAWLAGVEANAGQITFTADVTRENDCNDPGQPVWREIAGTFQSPLFLTEDLSDDGVGFPNLGPDGLPVQNGFTNPEYTATIPCSVFDDEVVTRTVLFGHGIFQRGSFFTGLVPSVVHEVVPWEAIGIATDWRGLSGLDVLWIGERIIGLGQNQLNDFPGFPARLRQGMLNTLVLTRMAKLGLFNRDPDFQRPGDIGVFPGPSEEMGYYGVSLGGIMGTYLAGLTPDIDRFGLDVPGVNFSCMLQRATPFVAFDVLLNGIGLTDPMLQILGVTLTHEVWAAAEPLSVIHHVRGDLLPGSGTTPKKILYAGAWLDKQVSNTCTEIAARTMGLPVLEGSIQQDLEQMDTVPGPVEAALVFWDLGELDITNPAHEPFIPPLANLFPSAVCDPHPRRPFLPASIRQLLGFLQPGGMIENTCSGLCDGDVPDEIPSGQSCDPLG